MNSSRLVAWIVWTIASIFYAYQYILRVMPNIMLGDIMQQFGMDTATMGQFSGIYYIGYSLMHLPIGIMLDRYGPKKVIPACILLSVAGLLPLIYTDYWLYPIIGRLMIGMGSSAAILGVFKIVRMAFNEERFSRMLSLSVTIGLLGAIYGGGPLSYMHEVLGYRSVVECFAMVGVVLAGFSFWLIPSMTSTPQTAVIADIKEVLSNRLVMATCLCAGLMVGPLEGFADVWGTVFLKQVYGFESVVAATLPSTIFIGMCFGAPLLNFIAEKIGSYMITIIVAGTTMAAIFAALLLLQLTPNLITINFLIVGICCAYQILAIYKASTFVSENVAGLTTALANMVIMIFGYGFHTAIGTLIQATGGPHSSQALLYGITVIPVALFIGTLGFIYILKCERVRQGQQFSD